MKLWVCALLTYVLAAGLAARAGDEIEVGMAREQVIEKLGAPAGEAHAGNGEILLYPRGTVELLDGKVFRSALLTEEEQQLRVEQEAKRREAASARAETRRREGAAEKERVLRSGAFAQQPAGQRVAFWQDFQRKYPEVGLDQASYQEALRELQEERKAAAAAAEAAAAADAADPGPKPRVSSREMRKMKRAGTWKW